MIVSVQYLGHEGCQLQSQLLVERELALDDLLDDLVTEEGPLPVSLAGHVLPPEEPVLVDEPDDPLVLELAHALLAQGSLPARDDVTYLDGLRKVEV